jgi:hypothetical protein
VEVEVSWFDGEIVECAKLRRCGDDGKERLRTSKEKLCLKLYDVYWMVQTERQWDKEVWVSFDAVYDVQLKRNGGLEGERLLTDFLG